MNRRSFLISLVLVSTCLSLYCRKKPSLSLIPHSEKIYRGTVVDFVQAHGQSRISLAFPNGVRTDFYTPYRTQFLVVMWYAQKILILYGMKTM